MSNQDNRTIVIGDIHGCYYSMVDLLSKVGYSSTSDMLVFLGDYIDRGPFGCKVVKTIRHLQAQVGAEKCICIRGNHEQFAIDCHGHLDHLWAWNGGYTTVMDYERNGVDMESDIDWFQSLPLFHETERFIFCHAGLTHPALQDNSQDDLLWGRDWIKKDRRPREKQVVFGHTRCSPPSVTMTGDIGIDGGCVYGGKLCAMTIDQDRTYHFVTVNKSSKDEEEPT